VENGQRKLTVLEADKVLYCPSYDSRKALAAPKILTSGWSRVLFQPMTCASQKKIGIVLGITPMLQRKRSNRP